ncbi:MAG: hypothetical protein ACUVTM_01950 [Candidatus Bathyarchaeia archaeon]
MIEHKYNRDLEVRREDKEGKGYLDLRLLGRITTYAIIVMIILGLIFLTGVIFWLLRRLLQP